MGRAREGQRQGSPLPQISQYLSSAGTDDVLVIDQPSRRDDLLLRHFQPNQNNSDSLSLFPRENSLRIREVMQSRPFEESCLLYDG